MEIKGLLKNGFVLSGRVCAEIELQEPDLRSHREIYRFFDELKGKRVRLTIEAV